MTRCYSFWVCVAVVTWSAVLATAQADFQTLENDHVDAANNATAERNQRFISLFTVVRFSNSMCTSSSNYSGTCLTSGECSAGGGTSSGSCASGFGVCCVFSLSTCGSSSSRNCTYITNPSSLSTSQTCMYTINKCDSSICQIRLDFYKLQIANPTATTSVCDDDKFVVTGASSTAPTICGQSNANQHMYFDVSSTSGIKLNFLLSSTTGTAATRSWSIKATQLACNSLITAPPNCLQYYTDLSGTITSFNFDSSSSATSRRHLANQDYEICFRMVLNYCQICYTICTLTPTTDAFAISGPAAMSNYNAACTVDYVIIPGAYNQGQAGVATMFADRLCGSRLNAMNAAMSANSVTVCSARKPFRMHFVTDSGAVDATNDLETATQTGFCLNYSQLPC